MTISISGSAKIDKSLSNSPRGHSPPTSKKRTRCSNSDKLPSSCQRRSVSSVPHQTNDPSHSINIDGSSDNAAKASSKVSGNGWRKSVETSGRVGTISPSTWHSVGLGSEFQVACTQIFQGRQSIRWQFHRARQETKKLEARVGWPANRDTTRFHQRWGSPRFRVPRSGGDGGFRILRGRSTFPTT